MRLGGAVLKPYSSPAQWLEHVRELSYSAVVFPVDSRASSQVRSDYAQCARDNDLLIGEVGIWKNCFSPDKATREAALDFSYRQLELAEEVGANCCVNISGSCGEPWASYHPDNFSRETYDRVVETTQRIIDKIKPTRTTYTIEPMPWMCPDSPEQYLQLIKDVDREAFAVHLDYTNMINSMARYHDAQAFVAHCFELLGPHIRSIHAKDIMIPREKITVVINEVLPGTGIIDLPAVCRMAHALSDDIPVFVEHLGSHEEYLKAVAAMRDAARKAGVPVK